MSTAYMNIAHSSSGGVTVNSNATLHQKGNYTQMYHRGTNADGSTVFHRLIKLGTAIAAGENFNQPAANRYIPLGGYMDWHAMYVWDLGYDNNPLNL